MFGKDFAIKNFQDVGFDFKWHLTPPDVLFISVCKLLFLNYHVIKSCLIFCLAMAYLLMEKGRFLNQKISFFLNFYTFICITGLEI